MSRSRAARCLAISLALAPSAALAQAPTVSGGPWRPELSVDPDAVPYVSGTRVPGAGNWNLGAVVEYVREPLRVTRDGETTALLRDQLWTTLNFQVGIGSRIGVGLQVPMLLYQASNVGGTGLSEPATTAVGDPRLVLRWSTRRELPPPPVGRDGRVRAGDFAQRQRAEREGLGLSLNLAGTAPIADATTFATAGAPTVHAFAVLDYRLSLVMAALSIGYRARLDGAWPSQSAGCNDASPAGCLYDVPLRDQITWGFAIRRPLEALLVAILLPISPRLASAGIFSGSYGGTYLTFQGAVDARYPLSRAVTSPLEMGAGVQAFIGEFTLSLGASWGLTDAPGNAAVRAIAGLQWAPRFIDDDRDGLRDDPEIDHCPGLREDFDGYQDDDGCPEDNDTDPIPDDEDRCPFENEDEDGFEDDDGCPDPDNDRDGVLDTDDACPDEAQGEHPDPARRGCPNNDLDGDGVSNADDACPDAAQGEHPDPARRGCPAPDGDSDGVPDADDRCPTVAQGANPQPWQMGCPVTDADHDGVPDASDRCPNEAETINGVTDDDGCAEAPPRPGAPVAGAVVRARVVRAGDDARGAVVLNEPVRFGANDAVLAVNRALMAQVALAVRAVARGPGSPVVLSVRLGPGVDAARANRRRDAAIAALRALGVTENDLVAGEPAPALTPAERARTPDRGVVLTVRQ
ncbi:MAG: hypothetical protein R3A52_02650 [Polyangiales bacterium]